MTTGLRGRVAIVFGTRPEIIKLAPVLRELGDAARPVFTGQHYDDELARDILLSCGLPHLTPNLNDVGGADRGEQVATMVAGLTRIFRNDRPDSVVILGDTNSANAAAQSAHYLGLPVIHVEAGLRSGDRGMPEEINRCLIAVLADVHCAATVGNVENLLAMGVHSERIHLTGNPVVEAVTYLMPSAAARAAALTAYGLSTGDFVLATIHRPVNTDNPRRLRTIIEQLSDLGQPVVFPAHPRTTRRLSAEGMHPAARGLRLLPPLDYTTFLALASEAALIVSDSGGIQEEVTILKRPLVIVRPNTERPETIDAGFATLCEPDAIIQAVSTMARRPISASPSPFGDGKAARRIARLASAFSRDRQEGRNGAIAPRPLPTRTNIPTARLPPGRRSGPRKRGDPNGQRRQGESSHRLSHDEMPRTNLHPPPVVTECQEEV